MRLLRVLSISVFLASCSEPNASKILGSWQIDSIYDYHNGFTFTNRNPSPREVYEYRKDNTLIRKGMGEQLEYRYSCNDSILTLMNRNGGLLGDHIIVQLNDHLLAIKENKKPMFQSAKETRYEIRYFSRTDSLK